MSLWWLSYADEQTDESRGVAVVRADSFLGAAAEARRLGISPGGQVQGFEAPLEEEVALRPYEGKLLSPEEAQRVAGSGGVNG